MKRPIPQAQSLPTRRQVATGYAAVQKNLREGTMNLSHENLAEKSDSSKDYQSLLERGERCPNLWIFIKIANAMDVDPVLMLSMTLARLRSEM